MDAGWMEKYSLASARIQLATLAMAWRSEIVTFLTVTGCASETRLLLACSEVCLVSAETHMTPFKPRINCTPATNQLLLQSCRDCKPIPTPYPKCCTHLFYLIASQDQVLA